MTITPEDYTALTGLTFTGIPVRLRSDGPLPTVAEGTRLMGSWLGQRLPSYQARGIPYADLMWGLERGVEESPLRQARLFYLHFITSTFLSGPTDTFDPRWIDWVEDVSSLGAYCWGDLGYATLVGQMSLAVRESDPRRRHFVIALAGVPRLIEVCASLFFAFMSLLGSLIYILFYCPFSFFYSFGPLSLYLGWLPERGKGLWSTLLVVVGAGRRS